MKRFFDLRDQAHTKAVFNKHADQETHKITLDVLHDALSELGNLLAAEEVNAVFETADTGGSGGLDEKEFLSVIRHPCKVEQWAATLPLPQLLAQCLSFKGGDEPLREVSQLSADELRASTDTFCDNLRKILAEALLELKACFNETDRKAAADAGNGSKFETFKMSSGHVADFHSGLLGRVGGCSRFLLLHSFC